MQAVRLRRTRTPGVYWGDDCRLYELVAGAEVTCNRCGKWAHAVFKWGRETVCERHFRIASRTRIRMTTTFACRVYRDGADGIPAGLVLRRGAELAVAGPPQRHGKFDRFELADGGYVLVPRSRWAWAWDSQQKESADER